MASPFQIGITGGIGSGKSVVTKIFSSLGIPVYDADSHAKELMSTDNILIEQLKKEFGNSAYDSNGNMNRRFLAEQVFRAPERLAILNNLVHPRVALNYKNWVDSQQSKAYLIKEAALLFETGSYKEMDALILVTAPLPLRIERVKKRDQRSETEIRDIIERQWPEERANPLADYVIVNDETSAILPQVLKLHQKFLIMSTEPTKPIK